MTTLNYTCPHCGRENAPMGATRFLPTQATATLRLTNVLCADCHRTVQIARSFMQQRGMWFWNDGEWR